MQRSQERPSLSDVFGENARPRVVEVLAEADEPGITVTSIAEGADTSRSTVYRHLDALREAGVLIENTDYLPAKLYRLRSEIIAEAVDEALGVDDG